MHSSEEDLVGTSEDDEDFIVPSKYVRVTTYAEILSHRIQLPVYTTNCEEVQLDPQLVSEHRVRNSFKSFQPPYIRAIILLSFLLISFVVFGLKYEEYPIYGIID